MAITYHAGRRIQGLSTDMSSNIVTINHRLSSTDDHAYADLGSALSNSSWVMRYKMVISGYSASNSNPNNSYLFALSKTNTAEQNTQSLGFKLQIGGVGGSVAKVSGGTSSQNSGEGYSGADFTTTVANATWYIECIRNGADFSVRITTNSDYTGGENKTWSTSGTVEDLRYIKYTNRDDSSSSWVLVSTISDIKIYDGVTSATGTFVTDGTWTASASEKVTVATQDAKPLNVQLSSRLEETDTRKMYYYSDTPTLSYDLSTSTSWTTTGSNCSVNTTGQYLEGSSSTDNDRATKALGLTLSDTKFVVRQKMQLTDVTTGGNGQLYFGYTDKDNSTTVLGNRDGIGITIRTGADFLHTYALNQAWQSAETLTTTPTETTYYLEIIRNSPTEMTMKLFDNANYSGTATETVTNTISSSINGLDHITIGGWDNGATGNITARFSNIEIYNNVSTVSGFKEWKELGT